MTDKRRGLGRGLGALIPPVDVDAQAKPRPVDVFFESPAAPRDDDDVESSLPPGRAPRATPDAPRSQRSGRKSDGVDERKPRAARTHPGSSRTAGSRDLVPVPGAAFAEVPTSQIQANARQPRGVFDEEALEELAASIREVGLLQPVVVRPLTSVAGTVAYELVMGERR